jgi:hypothetical protein
MPSVAEHSCFSDTHNSQEQDSPVHFWSYLIGQAAQNAFSRAVVPPTKKVVVIEVVIQQVQLFPVLKPCRNGHNSVTD